MGPIKFTRPFSVIIKVMRRIIIALLLILLSLSLYAGPAGEIIHTAAQLVGTPYRFGGTTPSGFDCSGLLHYLYSGVVRNFPRTSRDQARTGIPVGRAELRPGDLVFYATGSSPTKITHAALYVGDNAVIQALSAGPQTGVVVTDMDERYWRNRYVTSRRVLADSLPPSGATVRATEPSGETPAEAVPVAKEKVIDKEGRERTVVTIGSRRFTLSSWEEWYANEQADFEAKLDGESRTAADELSDFEKWKKNNLPSP